MPNPVKPKTRADKPLEQEHFALLGRVVSAWSNLELRLAHTVAMHSSSKMRSILFAFETMTTRAKLQTASAVVAVEGGEDLRDALLPLLKQLQPLAGVRHAAAHSAWLGLTSRGHMLALNVEPGGESPNIGRVLWTKREFETAVRRINDLAVELKRLTDDYTWHHLPAEDFEIGLEEADFS